jgi:hypothetical protein
MWYSCCKAVLRIRIRTVPYVFGPPGSRSATLLCNTSNLVTTKRNESCFVSFRFEEKNVMSKSARPSQLFKKLQYFSLGFPLFPLLYLFMNSPSGLGLIRERLVGGQQQQQQQKQRQQQRQQQHQLLSAAPHTGPGGVRGHCGGI